MRTLIFIFPVLLKGILIISFILLGVMSGYSEKLDVVIQWEDTATLKVDGAIYPNELNGFPKLSFSIPHKHIDEIKITKLKKMEYAGEFPFEYPDQTFEILSFRKLMDRGNEINFLDIIPVQYDSIADIYYLIQSLEISITSHQNKANGHSSLRTGQGPGSSVLASGDWIKIPLVKQGVYKVNYQYLKDAGLDMNSFNPKNIKIYGNGGGMLPQSNREERTQDLIENSIFVSGQNDGIFNDNDYILFYGQDADEHSILEDGTIHYQKNVYSASCP